MNITYISKKAHCPMWNIAISIKGKYKLSSDNKTPFIATFLSSYCPIIENINLPKEKQDPNLITYAFCNTEECPCLKGFKETIDIRKDGYSQ